MSKKQKIIDSLLVGYERDLESSISFSEYLASSLVPRMVYDSFFENDDWVHFSDDEPIDSHQIFRVIRYRLRSKYWNMLFDACNLLQHVDYDTYKAIIDRHDSTYTFGVPDFNPRAVNYFVKNNNIKI